MSEEKLLDASEVAGILRVSRQWVYDHTPGRNGAPARKRPELPALRMGSAIRYREGKVREWLANREKEMAAVA